MIKCLRTLLTIGGLILLIAACSKDPSEMEPDPQQQPQQTDQDSVVPQDSTDSQDSPLDPDIISNYLVLKEATKITGALPTAMDGGIKTEVKDTIYTVAGYPMGNRMRFKHDPSQKVTGFNIQTAGSTFYFHVPEDVAEDQLIPEEENDTISVLVLDLDLNMDNMDAISCPFTVKLTIQPHDASGMPLDQFERWITVECTNEQSNCNDIRRLPRETFWEWDFTVREYNGEILNTLAPGLATPINSQGAGCCGDNGQSYSVSDSPSCVPNVTGNGMEWVELKVHDFSVRTFELLWFWDDGRLDVFGNHVKKQYDRATTNFCDETVGYTHANENYGVFRTTGRHDFTPGATQINLDLTGWEGGWRLPRTTNLIYTCNTLMLQWGGEDNWTAVYRDWKYDPNIDPTAFYQQWKPWFD